MRIVYSDPVAELRTLINKAQTLQNISHITLTAIQMRSVVEHKDLASVFPKFAAQRATTLRELEDQRNQLKLKASKAEGEERQAIFDEIDEVEIALTQQQRYIPKSLEEQGITFKVTMS